MLQHTFASNFKPFEDHSGILSQPQNLPPSIGQITLRCRDANATTEFYTGTLGMKLVSCAYQLNFLILFVTFSEKIFHQPFYFFISLIEVSHRAKKCQIEPIQLFLYPCCHFQTSQIPTKISKNFHLLRISYSLQGLSITIFLS